MCVYITTFILSVKTFLKCRHIPGTYFETIPTTPVALIVIQLQIFVSKLLILNFYQVYFFMHLPPEPKERWKVCLISKCVTWIPDQEYYLEINWAQPLIRPITVGLQKLKKLFWRKLKTFLPFQVTLFLSRLLHLQSLSVSPLSSVPQHSYKILIILKASSVDSASLLNAILFHPPFHCIATFSKCCKGNLSLEMLHTI